MKFKLDENFGAGLQSLFQKSGHDVETAVSENLSGTTDEHIFEICCNIFRMHHRFSMKLFESMIDRFLLELDVLGLKGDLWIVEPGRIRVHKTDEDD